MKVLVTGGAGFIGSNLTARLVTSGMEVVVLDDLSTGSLDNLAGVRAAAYVGSILDPLALDEVMAGVDAVVHLAAVPSVPRSIVDPFRSHTVNVTGTMTVLQAARRHDVQHVIVASSSSVYGDQPHPVKDESVLPQPLSPYAVSKLAAESYALAFGHCYGIGVTAFRFFNVYGPGQPADHAYAAVVPSFIDAALAGRPLHIYGDGLQSRDFTFVGSVCEVIARALTGRVTCAGPVNLAQGSRTSLLDLVAMLEQVVGERLVVEHLDPRPGDVRHSRAGTDRLSGLFPGLAPFDLATGLTETLAWFRSRQPVPELVLSDAGVPAPRRPLQTVPRPS